MSSLRRSHRRWRLAVAATVLAVIAVNPTTAGAQSADAVTPVLRGSDPAPIVDELAPSRTKAGDAEKKSDAQKSGTKKKLPKKLNRLPAVAPYLRAQRLDVRGGPLAVPQAQPGPTIAAEPAPRAPKRPKLEDRPFDPVGIGLGDLRLTPSLEESVGWNSNPLLLPGTQRGSAFLTTEAGLGIQSNWSRDDLHGSFKGGYTDYFNEHDADSGYGSGTLGGRLDVSHDLSFDGEGRFNVSAQTPGSVGLPAGTTLRTEPLVSTYGSTLGATEKLGVFALGLHGTLDRTIYQDARFSDGAIGRLSSDDFNDWGLKARFAYERSPVAQPFVELGVDSRRYDGTIDSAGYARNSNGAIADVGIKVDWSKLLTGEFSVGYGSRNYSDARLPRLSGALVNGNLIWSATPLTTVTFKTATALNDTTTAAASGAVTHSYTLEIAHDLRRNLTIGAFAGLTTDDYVGVALKDHTTSAGLKTQYKISRDLVLKATATRSQYVTTLPGQNYVDTTFMLGLRLQR